MGMKHRKITPLWPAAKAQVEWFNKPLKIIKPGKDHPNFKCGGELVFTTVFLLTELNYQDTPHSSTAVSPASLMMNRHIRTKIP